MRATVIRKTVMFLENTTGQCRPVVPVVLSRIYESKSYEFLENFQKIIKAS